MRLISLTSITAQNDAKTELYSISNRRFTLARMRYCCVMFDFLYLILETSLLNLCARSGFIGQE